MAELIVAIGTAGAVANIVDALTKTINTINKLHSQWVDADLTFLSLVSQLTSLKAALTKIREWTDGEPSQQYHQLVMDLDGSLKCCRIIITTIDSHLAELHVDQDEKLSFKSKVKLVMNSKNMEALQKIIEQQTSALTLLLTACNCKAISEQKQFLEKKSTRKVFKQLEDDTASLTVQRDATSTRSQRSISSSFSKLSWTFQFDRELLGSKVYMRWSRDNIRKVLMARRASTGSLEAENGRLRATQSVPGNASPEATTTRREDLVIVVGTENSGRICMMSRFQNTHQLLTRKVQSANSSGRQVELRPDSPAETIHELVLDVKGRTTRLVDIGDQPDQLHEELRADNATSILFIVDLASCFQIADDHEGSTMLSLSLQLFDVLIRSTLCHDKPGIMLLATNAAVFAEQVKAGLLIHYFPDYKGGRDLVAAERYVLKRFIALNIHNLDIYPHMVRSYEDEDISLALKYVFSATRDSALRKALRGAADGYTIVANNQFRTLQPQRS